MSERESTIQARIWRALGALPGVRLFRNDSGVGWAGKLIQQEGQQVTLNNARRVTYGLTPGSADLVGWQSVEITQDMVGQRVAVFTSLEVKTPTGRLEKKQRQWLDAVDEAGGIAGVARSPEEALEILHKQGDA